MSPTEWDTILDFAQGACTGTLHDRHAAVCSALRTGTIPGKPPALSTFRRHWRARFGRDRRTGHSDRGRPGGSPHRARARPGPAREEKESLLSAQAEMDRMVQRLHREGDCALPPGVLHKYRSLRKAVGRALRPARARAQGSADAPGEEGRAAYRRAVVQRVRWFISDLRSALGRRPGQSGTPSFHPFVPNLSALLSAGSGMDVLPGGGEPALDPPSQGLGSSAPLAPIPPELIARIVLRGLSHRPVGKRRRAWSLLTSPDLVCLAPDFCAALLQEGARMRAHRACATAAMARLRASEFPLVRQVCARAEAHTPSFKPDVKL